MEDGINKLARQNSHPTGIEIELDFTNGHGLRIHTAAVIAMHGFLQHEISYHSMEFGTEGANTPEQSLNAIFEQMSKLSKILGEGEIMFPFGSLPNARSDEEQKMAITHLRNHPEEYYQYLLQNRDGSIVSEVLDVNGLQFHVGIPEEERFEILIQRFNVLRFLTPLFQGISASSPIRNSQYRGYSSEREIAKRSLLMGGIPDYLEDLDDLDFILNTRPSNHRESLSPGYYNLRYPRKDINTTELCAMDMIPDKNLIVALLDLYHRICRKIDTVDYEMLPENIFGDPTRLRMSHIIKHNLQSVSSMQTPLRNTEIVLSKNSKISFVDWIKNIYAWIQDVPTEISNHDSFEIIMSLLEKGTHSEQLIEALHKDQTIPPYQFGEVQVYTQAQMNCIIALYNNHSQSNLFSQL